jgi:hypothetical protein
MNYACPPTEYRNITVYQNYILIFNLYTVAALPVYAEQILSSSWLGVTVRVKPLLLGATGTLYLVTVDIFSSLFLSLVNEYFYKKWWGGGGI